MFRFLHSASDNFDRDMAEAHKQKPSVLEASRREAAALLAHLGRAAVHARPTFPDPSDNRRRQRRRSNNGWVLTKILREHDPVMQAREWFHLTDGANTVELSDDGNVVVRLHKHTVSDRGYAETQLSPGLVASTFNRREFDMRGEESSRLVRHVGELLVVGAPLSAHAPVTRTLIRDFVDEGVRQLVPVDVDPETTGT